MPNRRAYFEFYAVLAIAILAAGTIGVLGRLQEIVWALNRIAAALEQNGRRVRLRDGPSA